jgi:hypothetical protein
LDLYLWHWRDEGLDGGEEGRLIGHRMV